MAVFRVEAGETVTCTFTNTKKGMIIIEKQTLPDGNTVQSFSFSGDVSGSLKDGQTAEQAVVPGTYLSPIPVRRGRQLTLFTCGGTTSAVYEVFAEMAVISF